MCRECVCVSVHKPAEPQEQVHTQAYSGVVISVNVQSVHVCERAHKGADSHPPQVVIRF